MVLGKGRKMKTIDRIDRFVHARRFAGPQELANAVSEKFRVGVYISEHGTAHLDYFDVFFIRRGVWAKSAGSLTIGKQNYLSGATS